MRLDVVVFQQAAGAQDMRGHKDLLLCEWRGRSFGGDLWLGRDLQADPSDQPEPTKPEDDRHHQGGSEGHDGLPDECRE